MRTYIYGVPQGFDFYEKDVQFTDYFKSFYISSRRGRRFLINRKENGETIYTYLRYGMKEVCRQPQHAFSACRWLWRMVLIVRISRLCWNISNISSNALSPSTV